jgi:hypothetical protein
LSFTNKVIAFNTYFDRIALVGCDTTNIKQGLARNFAKTIYDNMPALRTAQITGRGGELEVNENGTKTMKTGGTKTVYSWYNGGIISTTRQFRHAIFTIGKIFSMINKIKTHIAFGGINLIV